jgi:type IV pilus assembly protein PilQ
MDGLKHLSLIIITLAICIGCATDTFDTGSNPEDVSAIDSSGLGDAALESDLKQTDSKTSQAENNSATDNQVQDDKVANDQVAPADQNTNDDFAQFDENPPPAEKQADQAPPPVEPAPQAKAETPPPEVTPPLEVVPPVEVEPAPEAPPVVKEELPPPPAEPQKEVETSNLVHLKQLLFKGNDSGGTVVVEADGPMTYSTRMNYSTGQYVVEIPNSVISQRLEHPYITKDFESMIGGIDAYQRRGSNISRIVIHLKPGATEPVVQSEGSSLMIVSNEQNVSQPQTSAAKEQVPLLSYSSLEDFINSNMVFSGKKISLETDDIELKDLFKLIGEEAGINLMIGDDVKGYMSVKLRQVPWDQALVMILKSKKLAYQKSGNILRIVSISDIRAEEKELIDSAKAKQTMDPLLVKVIPINYAKIDEITKQVQPFLTKERGSVQGDTRTNAIVVSDVSEVINRVIKLIQAIDIPPQQVLIEGKVVEAQDTFENQLGVQWFATGVPSQLGTSTVGGLIAGQGGVNVSPAQVSSPTMQMNFNLGVLDVLGNLGLILQLQETEGNVKVLSSPRVLALHNEEAKISQTQEIPITTSTASANGAPPVVTVTYKPVKLELGVTPQITNDGAVMMKVDVTREFAGATTDPKSPPPINSRKSNTKVLVRNGQTAVIGGIYQDDHQDSESRVPWLSNIPILGWLFKSKAVRDTKNELLIFLTPRILAQYDSNSPVTNQNNTNESKGIPTPNANKSEIIDE